MTEAQKQFYRFVATGAVAAAVNLVCRYILNFWMSFSLAVLLAYLCGMLTAYVLNRIYVFERSGRAVADELWRFTLVNLIAALQVWITSVVLASYILPALGIVHFRLEVAHVIGVSMPIFTSYFGHRYFSFAKSPTAEPEV